MSTISEIRTALPTGTWQVDPVHSTVGFSVKHMVVANFRGGFDTFDVTLDESGLRGTVDVASVSVSEPNLNGHLLSPDFFDAERHPQLSFRSTAIARRRRRARHRRRADAQGRHAAGHDHGHGERPGHPRRSTAAPASASSSRRSSTARRSASTGTHRSRPAASRSATTSSSYAELELVLPRRRR